MAEDQSPGSSEPNTSVTLSDTVVAREYLSLVRHSETQRTLRTAIISGVILAGLYMISYSVTRSLMPVWGIILMLLFLGIPSVVTFSVLGIYRRDCLKQGRRTALLEKEIDPARTSSASRSLGAGLVDPLTGTGREGE